MEPSGSGGDGLATGGDTIADQGPRARSMQETLAGDAPDVGASGPYADEEAPARIGRYVLLGVLGSGGMGVVHAAYDPQLDRRIALKLLRATGRSSKSRQRLLQEAQAMARLSHPNVVTVHDVGEFEGRVFVAMESVEGRTLTRWLAERERSVREIIQVFVQAGRGLVAAHAKGLVHRDFKPDNVMVGDDGRVRVMDFGLARATDYTADDLEPVSGGVASSAAAPANRVTADGALVGTPLYMAPEQWHGEQVDARTDQFSFCVALYEALYGESPFAGRSVGSLALSVTGASPKVQPSSLAIPSEVVECCHRGLSTEPSDRFPSMEPLLARLERDPWRRRRQLLAGGGVVALLAAVGGGWFITRARHLERCDQEGASISQVWSDAQRVDAERAFHASGVSYAADSYTRIVPPLDAYALSWSQLRRSVCIDARTGERRTPAHNDLAAKCLDDRKQELAALVDELRRGTSAIVRDGMLATASLPPVERCVDEVSLQEWADTPDDPQRAAAVAGVQDTIDASRRRAIVADFEAALERAAEAREGAEAIGWLPLRAQAAAALADAQYERGLHAEAEATYRDAFRLALASGRNSLAADAAEGLARLLGADRSRPVDGLHWVDIAQALYARLGRTSGDIHRLRGMLLVEAGEPAAAETEMDLAVELDREKYGLEHPFTALSLQSRCNVYSDLGRYDEALSCNERAVEVQTTLHGPGHPTVAVAKNNMGGLLAKMGRLDEAYAMLEEAVELRKRALGPDHVDVGRSLMNLGAAAGMKGDLEAAQAHLEPAIGILERVFGPDDPSVAQGLVNLANLQLERGDVAGARRSAERALSMLEAGLGPDHPSLRTALSLLGHVERREGNLSGAEALHRRELEVAENPGGADPVSADLARTDLARVLLAQGRAAEALALIEPTFVRLFDALGSEHSHVAAAEYVLARAQASVGQTQAALEHARNVLKMREAAVDPDHEETKTVRAFVEELESKP